MYARTSATTYSVAAAAFKPSTRFCCGNCAPKAPQTLSHADNHRIIACGSGSPVALPPSAVCVQKPFRSLPRLRNAPEMQKKHAGNQKNCEKNLQIRRNVLTLQPLYRQQRPEPTVDAPERGKQYEFRSLLAETVPWMSGLVNGLQNRLQQFESARHLSQKKQNIPKVPQGDFRDFSVLCG